jgi:hypothetical protein
LDATASAPAGVKVVALHEVLDQADALFELYSQGRADVPSRVPRTAWTYSEWRSEILDHPLLDRRGAGLATLAKIHSTRCAAALGITRILTSNDIDNEPMLAINKRLGYTPTVAIESYAKAL